MNANFDVDDTLVMWEAEHTKPGRNKIRIVDPYDNSVVYLKPHKKHIKILKDLKIRGYTITVWSAGGYQWAEAVVKTLGIEDSVDIVMTKPTKLFDDLPLSELGSRVYIAFTEDADDEESLESEYV